MFLRLILQCIFRFFFFFQNLMFKSRTKVQIEVQNFNLCIPAGLDHVYGWDGGMSIFSN